MTQISRPFQIALVTMGLIVAVWFVGMRGHSAGTSGSGAPAPAPAASSAPAAPGAPSSVYHGPASGVEGLTRAIAKAHATVAESERAAKQLQEKSAQASSPTSAGVVSGAATAGAGATTAGRGTSASGPWTSSWVASHRSAGHGASAIHGSAGRGLSGIHGSTATQGLAITQHPAVSRNSAPTHAPPAASRPAGARGTSAAKGSPNVRGSKIGAKPAMQVAVEHELAHGRLVAILFWNPVGPVDQQVHHELQAARHELGGTVALHVARASQLVSFGSLLRAAPIDETPTILLVNKRGRMRSVAGLTDAYAIEQAIAEVRRA